MRFAVLWLRYIRGYVSVCATGGFPERFINLCHSHRINLWNVCLQNKILTFCVSGKDFLKLRNITKKSGVKIKITGKSGLVYSYRKYSKRVGFITGIILFALIHIILNMFVWCTDVQGNTEISKSDITARAELYGLSAGTVKKDFDEILASRKIAADYGGKITWLSINIKGSLAVIELREDKSIIAEAEDRTPCNIVADFDGLILSAETLYGDCMVESGTGVRKGDLLISGAIINEDLSTDFYAAKGKITALHEKEINREIKKKDRTAKIKADRKSFRLGFFGLEIPLGISGSDKNQLTLKERKTLSINGYSLPFYIEKSLICSRSDTVFPADEFYICGLEKIQNYIYKENANSTLVTADEAVSSSYGNINFKGKYTLIDFLGEEKPILSSETK